jgi:hypothetical protein
MQQRFPHPHPVARSRTGCNNCTRGVPIAPHCCCCCCCWSVDSCDLGSENLQCHGRWPRTSTSAPVTGSACACGLQSSLHHSHHQWPYLSKRCLLADGASASAGPASASFAPRCYCYCARTGCALDLWPVWNLGSVIRGKRYNAQVGYHTLPAPFPFSTPSTTGRKRSVDGSSNQTPNESATDILHCSTRGWH